MRKINNIKHVHIETLIDILTELWDRGVDFVDLHGSIISENEHALGISFSKEYMDVDSQEDFENVLEDDISKDEISVSLTDDDVNKLI